MNTNELIQEAASRFAELKALPVINTSAVIELRKLLEQLNALDNDAEADSLKIEIENRITLCFYVGREVSLTGQSDYHGEAIDVAVTITGFREDPSKKGQMLVDYRTDERSADCTLPDGAEATLSLGREWSLTYYVEAKRDANPVLILKQMIPPQG